MTVPFQPVSGEKADRMAQERNRKQAEKYPLLAQVGLLEQTTGEQIRDASEAHAESWQILLEELEARAVEFRAQVAALVGEDELAALEQRLSVLPDCPACRADFWSLAWMRLTSGSLLMPSSFLRS
jgi:hypothetical protein